jgi:hypothetical protein
LRRVELGQIKPELLPEGVTYYGRLLEIGVDIFGYDEWYLDDDGNEQPMVPVKSVLMGSTQAQTSMLYGAIAHVHEEKPAEIYALPRVPKSWVNEKRTARFLEIASRPLPVPTQIDAFYVATVL